MLNYARWIPVLADVVQDNKWRFGRKPNGNGAIWGTILGILITAAVTYFARGRGNDFLQNAKGRSGDILQSAIEPIQNRFTNQTNKNEVATMEKFDIEDIVPNS